MFTTCVWVLSTENLVTNGKLDNGFSMAFPAYMASGGIGGGGGPTLDSGHLFLTPVSYTHLDVYKRQV